MANKLQMEHSRAPLTIEPHNFTPVLKQIDSRWVEIKFGKNYTPRSYFAATIQAGNVYVHGGFNAEVGIMGDLNTCCLYDQPPVWKELPRTKHRPGPLRNHSLNNHLANLILVGGQRNVVENNDEIYRYDLIGQQWQKCTCLNQGKPFPFALDSHSATVHKINLYIFGGYDAKTTEYMPYVIKINLENIQANQLTYQIISSNCQPKPRANSSCCLVNSQIYLFGGGRISEVYDDFWTFDVESEKWTEIKKEGQKFSWPEKRRGGTLVHHALSNCLFLFGGIRRITKEQNDVMVYMLGRKRWIKIHSNTNQLYDPSPTVKELVESPTIAEVKRNKERSAVKTSQGFRIGIKPIGPSEARMHETTGFFRRDSSPNETQYKRKMSVVQEKKYREFMARKRKLLKNIESGYVQGEKQRSRSPTSEALLFSLTSLGQQNANPQNELDLPKVIFDGQKGHVIGKKPCARDGHAALVHQDSMVILGGDRHMVAFNDAYLFKLNKAVETLPHYEQSQ